MALNGLKAPVAQVRASLTTYEATPNPTTLQNFKNNVTVAQAGTSLLWGHVNTAGPPASITNAAATAVSITPQVDQMSTSLPNMITGVNNTQASLATLPNTADLINSLDGIIASWATLPKPKPSKLVDPMMSYMDTLYTAGVTTPQAAWKDINSTISKFSGQTSMITKVVNQITKFNKDYKSKSNKMFQMGVEALWGLYALLAGFCIMLLIFAVFNYTFGVRLFPALVLILIVLLLLLAVLWAVAIVLFNDICFNMESLVLEQNFVDKNMTGLMSFYMLPKSSNQNITQVLKNSGIIDVDEVIDGVRAASRNLTANLQESFQLQAKAMGIVNAATDVTDAVANNVTSALQLANHDPLHNLYLSVKRWACCQLTDFARDQWIALTLSGLFAWILVLLLCCLVCSVDRSSQTFMGCECLPSKRIQEEQNPHNPWNADKKKKDPKYSELQMVAPDSPRITTAINESVAGEAADFHWPTFDTSGLSSIYNSRVSANSTTPLYGGPVSAPAWEDPDFEPAAPAARAAAPCRLANISGADDASAGFEMVPDSQAGYAPFGLETKAESTPVGFETAAASKAEHPPHGYEIAAVSKVDDASAGFGVALEPKFIFSAPAMPTQHVTESLI